jgi:hypothetical protein
MPESKQEEVKIHSPSPIRPMGLTVICLFSFIFFGLVSLLFLAAIFYTGSITEVLLRYAPENSISKTGIFFYAFGGFILHAAAFTGCIFMWRMKRNGYILFSLSSLTIAIYQLFEANLSPMTTAVYITLVIAFGIFLKKMK